MNTPQQFIESFLGAKAAIYGDANTRLKPVYTEYFGEPLLQRPENFLQRERVSSRMMALLHLTGQV
jgi:hypothetical protein